jgi:2-polyprenyl-3-methyl-5-hydroxy-6-metoxy-1,4-benzoquinol methylase
MDFSKRTTEKERMDNPEIDQMVLKAVFKDINRATRLLGGNRITIEAVARILRDYPKEEYTVLDVGCGDGNMLRTIARYCREENIKLNLIGTDLSEKALAIAKEQSRNYPEISYARQDILKLQADTTAGDIVLCTLTMHHFNNKQIHAFLKKFATMAAMGVVINDLQRSRWAYYLFRVFSAIFMRTEIAKHDGRISIKSGFTKNELREFSRSVPEANHRIQWKWAFRYVWVMRTDRLK